MKTSTKSFTHILPKELVFRLEAIKLIGSIVKAREYAVKHELERIHVADETRRSVREQYNAYKNTWPVSGVARFLIKNEITLMMMATGGKNQINQLKQLIFKAKQYEKI